MAMAPVVGTGALDESKAQASADFGAAVGAERCGFKRTSQPQSAPAAPNPFVRPNAGLAVQEQIVSANGALSSIAQTAAARELGELFEYRIAAPVTIRKSESAMLPFLQDKIAARKLLIYSDQSSVHPLNAAEITNSTGKTLAAGPITVFDPAPYAAIDLMPST